MAPSRKPSLGQGVSNEVLSEQVRGVSGRIDQIDITLRTVAESLTAFVRLEERHTSLLQRVEEMVSTLHAVDKRVTEMENVLPGLKEMRKYIVAVVVGVVALVGLGIYNGYMNTRQDMRATTSSSYNSVPNQSGSTAPRPTEP